MTTPTEEEDDFHTVAKNAASVANKINFATTFWIDDSSIPFPESMMTSENEENNTNKSNSDAEDAVIHVAKAVANLTPRIIGVKSSRYFCNHCCKRQKVETSAHDDLCAFVLQEITPLIEASQKLKQEISKNPQYVIQFIKTINKEFERTINTK